MKRLWTILKHATRGLGPVFQRGANFRRELRTLDRAAPDAQPRGHADPHGSDQPEVIRKAI